MSDESPGYDFFYEPEVRALLPSLTEHRTAGGAGVRDPDPAVAAKVHEGGIG